jgi:hypothetical protein
VLALYNGCLQGYQGYPLGPWSYMQAARGLVGPELVNRGAVALDRVVHQEQVQGRPATVAIAIALVLCTAAPPL